MKINVLRSLIVPWLVFFLMSLTALIVIGIRFPHLAQDPRLDMAILSVSALFCLFLNIKTLNKAGIWIAYTLPLSLRRHSWLWIVRAGLAALLALVFYGIGQMSWIPLMWQGFVIPAVFSLALFVGAWSLMGPILKWGANLSFGRVIVFVFTLPLLAIVGATTLFLGHNIVAAYHASRPEALPLLARELEEEKPASTTAAPTEATLDKRAQALREIAESGQPCPDSNKLVMVALEPSQPEDVAYWGVKAVKCTEMKAVIGLPRLADLMVKHPSPKVRAAAIRAMPKFGTENVKRIAYLLVKRLSEREPKEVLEAAAAVLPKLGEDEAKWTTARLKSLLDTGKSAVAAKILIKDLKREDLVAEYVGEHLEQAGPARERAVSMICELPTAQRASAEPQAASIVATIKKPSHDDTAMAALDCMGRVGFQALREEVMKPQHLNRELAVQALAQMDLRTAPEALETVETCLRDPSEEVRHYCSQSLGKIGGPALPKIMDLLESGDSQEKDAARNALNYFDDPNAKDELQKIRAENSGWMANRKKLQIADAVSKPLAKIMLEEMKAEQKTDQ